MRFAYSSSVIDANLDIAVDREEVDRLRKRFMKLDKVTAFLVRLAGRPRLTPSSGQLWHHRARRVSEPPANLFQPPGNTVRSSSMQDRLVR